MNQNKRPLKSNKEFVANKIIEHLINRDEQLKELATLKEKSKLLFNVLSNFSHTVEYCNHNFEEDPVGDKCRNYIITSPNGYRMFNSDHTKVKVGLSNRHTCGFCFEYYCNEHIDDVSDAEGIGEDWKETICVKCKEIQDDLIN